MRLFLFYKSFFNNLVNHFRIGVLKFIVPVPSSVHTPIIHKKGSLSTFLLHKKSCYPAEYQPMQQHPLLCSQLFTLLTLRPWTRRCHHHHRRTLLPSPQLSPRPSLLLPSRLLRPCQWLPLWLHPDPL